MNIKEFLESILTDEQKQKLTVELNGKEIMINDGSFIPKSRFDEVNEKKKILEETVKTFEKEIGDLKIKSTDSDKTKEEVNRLQETIKTLSAEKEKEIKELTLNMKLNEELSKLKVRDMEVIKLLIDKSKISLDGENIIGLNDQINKIKETKDYLFTNDIKGNEPNQGIKTGTNPILDNPFDSKTENLTKQGELIMKDINKARELCIAAGKKPYF